MSLSQYFITGLRCLALCCGACSCRCERGLSGVWTHLRVMVFVGDLDGVRRVVDGDDKAPRGAQSILRPHLAVLERLQLGQTHAHAPGLDELLPARSHTQIHRAASAAQPRMTRDATPALVLRLAITAEFWRPFVLFVFVFLLSLSWWGLMK